MRIPAELIHPNESDRFAQEQGTRPVDVAARLASDLPAGLRKPRQAPEAPPGKEAARRPEDDQERRQQDRRQKNVPITLDTRVARSRRKSESPISVAI